MPCEKCTDPDGVPCFPTYGLGPHIHYNGATLFAEQKADGFTPDPDCPGMGTWWCPHCGDGKPDEAKEGKRLNPPPNQTPPALAE